MKILVDNKTKCGVYKIRNIVNNKCYIGSTTGTLKNRCITHRCNLRYNRHTNQHLQNSWNKYGEDGFEFSLVELCQPNQCFDREQYYIDILKPEYNIIQFVGQGILGYKHTDEAKKKISIAFAGKNHPAYSGEYVFYHPLYGIIIDDQKSISKKYNLTYTTINKMCLRKLNHHKRWIYLGKFDSEFKNPDNIDKIYNEKLNVQKKKRAIELKISN